MLLAADLVAQATFTPPRVISRAPNVVEPKGPGSVTVQVLVNANGTFKVQRVMNSTNPGDNAAAIDIAQRSKYAPAKRNGQAVRDFYDFTISFGQAAVSGAAGRIDTLLHQSQWAQAKSAATGALQQNANDPLVQAQLGVADAYLHDVNGAVVAFNRAGTVPPQYANVAMQAYSVDAESKVSSDPKAALAEAQKAASMDGDFGAYYALGLAQHANGNDSAAEESLEKAAALGQAAGEVAKPTLAQIDQELMLIAASRGDTSVAARAQSDLTALDPNMGPKLSAYNDDVQGVAAQKRGDVPGAIKSFESAAAADPSWAGATEYTKAAILMATQAVPNLPGAKTEADKAIAADANYALAYYVAGVAMGQNANVTGSADQAQDANTYLHKAAQLARAQNNGKLAEAAEYFAANHNVNANLLQWSTTISLHPAQSMYNQ